MERYYKDIEGSRVWYEGVIDNGSSKTYTWDEALILAAGWTKYIPEPHIPTLEEVKAAKLAEIDAYDSSEAVNTFFIGNQALWLDKATRTSLSFSLAMEEASGRTTSTLWYGGMSFTLPIEGFKQMLAAVEVYAKDSYNVTQSHKAAVSALESIEEVEAYDYTVGYPERISFEQ